jgi:hypothetical protein
MSSDRPTFSANADVRIDAWTGTEAAAQAMAKSRAAWALGKSVVPRGGGLAPVPPDPADWRSPEVGWGVVLPEHPGLDPAALGRADDAPEPIRALVAARSGKVVRYRAGALYADWVLRDWAGGDDLPIATSPLGTGPGCLPSYLLIVGSPADVPWRVQYALNTVRNVGRLDLDELGLERYVEALLADWNDSGARYAAPVVWSVEHGGGDITTLMRDAVGEPLYTAFAADPDMPDARFIDGRAETADASALVHALASSRPLLVVSTSHGMTGPLDQPSVMRAQLGLPVDAAHGVVDPDALLATWQPDGAVWFAQACCSAGSDAPSAYHGLFDPAGLVDQVLEGVAQLGALTSPLPRALLGAQRPLRAFIGHVEPTFDWTMVFPPNRKRLTDSLRNAVYTKLCSGSPAGLALSSVYAAIGALLLGHSRSVDAHNDNPPGPARTDALDMALYNKVTAYDRASTVLLGDPTVRIPVPN